MTESKILRNRAQCRVCHEIIESTYRHDYQSCSCGAIAVDGGTDYLRRTGSLIDIIELSESTEASERPVPAPPSVSEQSEPTWTPPPSQGVSVSIAPARNGWVLTIRRPQDEEPETAVYQESYDHEDEIEAFADLLWFLNDEYGPSTSRYSPKRIVIRIEPGDKCENAGE